MADVNQGTHAVDDHLPNQGTFTLRVRDDRIQCTCLPGSSRLAKDMILCVIDTNQLVWSHQPCQVEELNYRPRNVWPGLSDIWLASRAVLSKDTGQIKPAHMIDNENSTLSRTRGDKGKRHEHSERHRLFKHVTTTFCCDASCTGSNRLCDYFWCKKCCGWQHRACMRYGEPGDRGGPVCNVCYKHFFDHIHEYRAWQKQRQLEVVRHAWAFIVAPENQCQTWRLNLVKGFLWGFFVEHRRQFLLEQKRNADAFEQRSNRPNVSDSVPTRWSSREHSFIGRNYYEESEWDRNDIAPSETESEVFEPQQSGTDNELFHHGQQIRDRTIIPPPKLHKTSRPPGMTWFTPHAAASTTPETSTCHPPKRPASAFQLKTPSRTPVPSRPIKRPKARQPSPDSDTVSLCSCNPQPDMTNGLSFTCRRCSRDQHATCAIAINQDVPSHSQALFCNDCQPTTRITTPGSLGSLGASNPPDTEYLQSMNAEVESLSSTLLWKTWWELPSSSSVLRSPAPVSHNAPPPASHAFLLEATTRVNALLTAAGRDISTQILSPALAAFPRRPEIILNALRALMEIVLPTPAPPANWNFRTGNHGRVLSESDKAKFGVLLEIVRFAGKGEIWTYGRGVGWR